jgi:hypothetical protein
MLTSRCQLDGLLFTVAPAHAAAVAAKWVNESSLAGRRKTYGAELTG